MSFCSSCFKFLLKLLLTLAYMLIFYLFVLPLFLLILPPLGIHRWIVSKYALKFRPDLGKMVTTQGTIFGAEDIYSEQCITSLAATDLRTPHLDIEEVRKSVLENVINVKDPKTGKLVYPEMQQTVKSSNGYLFWTPVKNFHITNHVSIYETPAAPIDSKKKVADLFTDIVRHRKWIKGRPLWEVIIVNNVTSGEYEGVFTILIFRLHHLLCDGISTLKVCSKMFGYDRDMIPTAAFPKQNWASRISSFVLMVIKAPYDIAGLQIQSRFQNGEIPEVDATNDTTVAARSEEIPLKLMKDVKNQFGVSMTSLVVAVVAGAIRKKIECMHGPSAVSGSMQISFPLPLPGHPESKLRNHATMGTIALPLGEPDPVKRLRKIHQRISEIRNSSLPLLAHNLSILGGSLPYSWIKRMRQGTAGSPVVLTAMAGPSEVMHCFGVPALGQRVGSNFPDEGPKGFGLAFASYAGKAWFYGGARTKYLPELKDAQDLMQMCEDHLNELSRLGTV